MMSTDVLLFKFKAFLISLLPFGACAVALFIVTWQVWYPDYLFWTDGGLQGLRLVLLVELVLGPLLVLVFFHPEKTRSKLLFDVAVMVLVQVAAMAWGAHQVWSQRPLAVVYGSERFVSVAPDIMALQHRDEETLRSYSPDRPPFVYRREAVGTAESDRLAQMIFLHGFHPESQAWLFQPFRENLDRVFSRQEAFHRWIGHALASDWSTWSAGRNPSDISDYRFALFEGRYDNALLVFLADGRYVGYLPVGAGSLPVVEGGVQTDDQ